MMINTEEAETLNRVMSKISTNLFYTNYALSNKLNLLDFLKLEVLVKEFEISLKNIFFFRLIGEEAEYIASVRNLKKIIDVLPNMISELESEVKEKTKENLTMSMH